MAAPNELSFLPDDYLEKKSRRRANVFCAGLFLIVAGGIGGAFWISERGSRSLDAQFAVVNGKYAQAAQRIDQVRQMQEKQRVMSRQAELAASLLERVPRSYLLAELTNALPVGVSLVEFAMETKLRPAGVDATQSHDVRSKTSARGRKVPDAQSVNEVKQYDVFLKLTGVAGTDVQVAQYLNLLGQSKLLKDVTLVISDEFAQGDKKLRRFTVEMQIDPRAEVQPTTRPSADPALVRALGEVGGDTATVGEAPGAE